MLFSRLNYLFLFHFFSVFISSLSSYTLHHHWEYYYIKCLNVYNSEINIYNNITQVRVSKKFGWDISPLSYEQAVSASHKVLDHLNNHLDNGVRVGRVWLVEGDIPTIADIAIFPYVAFTEHSSEGEISLTMYPAVAAWIERFKSLPGYLSPPGI